MTAAATEAASVKAEQLSHEFPFFYYKNTTATGALQDILKSNSVMRLATATVETSSDYC
jgi:hypothetical protein